MQVAAGSGASQTARPPRWEAPLGAGLALAGLLALGLSISIWIGRAPGWAYDFSAYYEAAQRLLATGSPYQAETLGGPFRPGPFGLYLYSPILALLVAPLTALGEQGAVLVWLFLRVGVLVLTCALMPVPRAIRMATFGVAALSAATLRDFDLGNVSLLVTLFAVVAWRWLDRPSGSVALALSLTVRPTMALICGWWLLRGLWRPVAWTVAAAVAVVLATLPFVGLDRWVEYVNVLRNVSNVSGVVSNVDLGSALLMLGGPAWAAPLVLFSGYVVAGAAVLMSLRRDRELSYVVTLMATLLLAPLLWDHYLTNLLVPAAFLASRGRTWGLALPLLCWLPTLLVANNPGLKGMADAVLPLVVIAGLLLPFAAPGRGDTAGLLVDLLARWRATRPARA